jgi:signal transduction histidine kinase
LLPFAQAISLFFSRSTGLEKMSLERLFHPFASRNLRTKVTLGVVLPLLLVMGLFTTIEYFRQRALLLNNLSLLASNAGQVIENNLRQEMLRSDFEGVQELLDSIGANEAYQGLYLLDTTGKVIFAPEGEGVGSRLDNNQPDCQPCHRLSPEDRPSSIVVTKADGQRVFRSMQPIENDQACNACHDPEQKLIGVLLIDASINSMEAPLKVFLREKLLWWTVTILTVVVVVNLALSRFVLGRLEKLADAISLFGHSQHPPPLDDNQPDEIGQLAEAFRTMTKNVEARREENRTLSEHLQRQSAQRGELLKRLITAQEDERKRVARELHDDMGQVFSGLAFRLEAIERDFTSDPDHALQQLEQSQNIVADGTDRMYDIILALRPSALDDLGLVAALNSHAKRLLKQTDINFELEVERMNGRLPPELETALYRIFQEALSNVVRHAEATKISITLACNNHTFEGKIEDNGRGFDLTSIQTNGDNIRGLGLLGMQERVIQCGGSMEIISDQGRGTQIQIFIPLTEGHYDGANSRSSR